MKTFFKIHWGGIISFIIIIISGSILMIFQNDAKWALIPLVSSPIPAFLQFFININK